MKTILMFIFRTVKDNFDNIVDSDIIMEDIDNNVRIVYISYRHHDATPN
jgi:hypothetical protein